MLRRALIVVSIVIVLVVGATLLISEQSPARAASPRGCVQPDCPVPLCPPCTSVVCDAGHCRYHCVLNPNCNR